MGGARFIREAAEAAEGARRQIARCSGILAELGRELRERPPPLVVTCARGSSDHAATYGKYLLETRVGRVVASVGPSVTSMVARGLALEGALFLAVSQSGRGPDLLALTAAAKRGGARVVGLVNDEASPLAALCDRLIPLSAGEERAVAATKSFLLSGLAFLQLAAAWSEDADLHATVAGAADAFDAAYALEATPALLPLATAANAYVIGRGVGLGPALEVALKLKETCRVHAEAFSSAEVLHGPIALVGPGFPVVAVEQEDETAPGTREVMSRLRGLGAAVQSLPAVPGVPAVLAPLCQVQTFYRALPALAALRGVDPDAPPHVSKVTETR